MRRNSRRISEEEMELLGEEANTDKKQWDSFLDTPRKLDSGSMADAKWFDRSEQFLKLFCLLVTFIVFLSAAIISKGSLLFMTSQVLNDTKPCCNVDLGRHKQFVVSLPDSERAIWIWMLAFAYFVPQLGIFLRSLRICVFKRWKSPNRNEFAMLFVTESLPTIGTALLVFCVLPEMDVVKGAMLTNAVCFIPAVVGFISRRPKCSKKKPHAEFCVQNTLKLNLDILSITAQVTALVVWPLVEGKAVLWLIPVSVILISFGWWENYVSEESPIKFIQKIARHRKVFQNSRYFMYIFVSIWKCLLFVTTMFAIFYVREDFDATALVDGFQEVLKSHHIFIREIQPILGTGDVANVSELISVGYGSTIITDRLTPMWVLLVNVLSTYICYIFGKFACKVKIQGFSFAFPINLAMPVTISALIAMTGTFVRDECAYYPTIPGYLFFDLPPLYFLKDFIGNQQAWIWLIWMLSQTWITIHIWSPTCEKLARTERIFVRPMYDPFLIDQDVAMNRRRDDNIDEYETDVDAKPSASNEDEIIETIKIKDSTTRIKACGTMWHETKEEMMEFLKSIMRLDEDHSARWIVRQFMGYELKDHYELETHIFFDDAFVRYKGDPDPHINRYVRDLVEAVDEAATDVHEVRMKLRPPQKYETPYGGQLVWTLPGHTKMVAHLKDKKKIRAKKRWSQVMYMYYLLGFKLMDENFSDKQKDVIAENTFLLALDGDVDFQPKAVTLLVDLMKKNKSLGAACGRIHPIGTGPMVWYQMFEYAVGHWLQKATEHMIGCVLCSPGCFSLFRGKALMDDRVMRKYTTVSTEALHYVQYDQGEDRWLCTLLLQRGFRVEYSAASDAYTHCPEGFNEFYNQRRRWMPSTTANIFDLLMDYKHTIKINDNISILYIAYQAVLMVGTVIGPGSIFLMLVGAFVAAFQMAQWTSFFWNAIPILIFMLALKLFKSDKIQLFFAGLISAVYGLVMMAVLVGVMLQISNDGPFAPSSLFLFLVAGEFIFTAILHPKEFNCLPYGIVYFVTVPSMYLLLAIYSVFNMNNVSWGTREITLEEVANPGQPSVTAAPAKEEPKATTKSKVMSMLGSGEKVTGAIEFSLAGLYKCVFCTHREDSKENDQLKEIQKNLDNIMKRLDNMGKEVEVDQPLRRKTIVIEGASGSAKLSKDPSEVTDTSSLQESIDAWMDDDVIYRGETKQLEPDERKFWTGLLEKYLLPIDDSKDKKRIKRNLDDLRDKMVFAFFMINALFVLIVFLLTLKKDLLHIKWPFGAKSNFTYIPDKNNGQIVVFNEYLQLEPIGLVFLVFFFFLLVVQFIGMLLHRFGTMCQILSNTTINSPFNSTPKKLSDADIAKQIASNALNIAREYQKLKFEDEDNDETFNNPARRHTIAHNLKVHSKRQNTIISLRKAYQERLQKYGSDTGTSKQATARRATVAMLGKREEQVEHTRKSVFSSGGFQPRGINNQAFNKDE